MRELTPMFNEINDAFALLTKRVETLEEENKALKPKKTLDKKK